MLEILTTIVVVQQVCSHFARDTKTYARTLEKSWDGDMTKLSLEDDQLIRCCMLGSSNML